MSGEPRSVERLDCPDAGCDWHVTTWADAGRIDVIDANATSAAVLLAKHIEEHAPRPLWRFDVPEVPAHVTAIRDCDGDVWLRTGGFWCLTSDRPDRPGSDLRDVLPHAPLVECEDPRAAS